MCKKTKGEKIGEKKSVTVIEKEVQLHLQMNEIILYFNIGLHHIIDLRGLQYILFLSVLSVRYQFTDWKKLFSIIAAITIGHLITSTLSVLHIIYASNKWTAFLIPIIIIIAVINNLPDKKVTGKSKYPTVYFIAAFFGLICGFKSDYLKSTLVRSDNLLLQTTALHVGVLLGQIFVMLGVLLVTFICVNLIKVNRREYLVFTSGLVLGIAIQMAITMSPF